VGTLSGRSRSSDGASVGLEVIVLGEKV
jgi:hypothetical protein